jgi:ribosomal protein S27E
MHPRTTDRPAPQPVERVLVQPPPEMHVRCAHCGVVRLGLWKVVGSMPLTGEIRRKCGSCGHVFVFSDDQKTMRQVG